MSSAAEHAERMAEEQERNRDAQLHGQQLGAMMQDLEDSRADLLETLVDTTLTEGERTLLENLLSQDFILANYTEEQLHELWWDIELIRVKFLRMHPGKECVITGIVREYAFDEFGNCLKPMDDMEKLKIDQFFKGVKSRITRAKKMKQQEELTKQRQESIVNKPSSKSGSGGLLGRLSR